MYSHTKDCQNPQLVLKPSLICYYNIFCNVGLFNRLSFSNQLRNKIAMLSMDGSKLQHLTFPLTLSLHHQ